jgi:hypothetical protein
MRELGQNDSCFDTVSAGQGREMTPFAIRYALFAIRHSLFAVLQDQHHG